MLKVPDSWTYTSKGDTRACVLAVPFWLRLLLGEGRAKLVGLHLLIPSPPPPAHLLWRVNKIPGVCRRTTGQGDRPFSSSAWDQGFVPIPHARPHILGGEREASECLLRMKALESDPRPPSTHTHIYPMLCRPVCGGEGWDIWRTMCLERRCALPALSKPVRKRT